MIACKRKDQKKTDHIKKKAAVTWILSALWMIMVDPFLPMAPTSFHLWCLVSSGIFYGWKITIRDNTEQPSLTYSLRHKCLDMARLMEWRHWFFWKQVPLKKYDQCKCQQTFSGLFLCTGRWNTTNLLFVQCFQFFHHDLMLTFQIFGGITQFQNGNIVCNILIENGFKQLFFCLTFRLKQSERLIWLHKQRTYRFQYTVLFVYILLQLISDDNVMPQNHENGE